MLAKKFSVGFGIALVLPMLVYYGVITFSSPPRWRDYQIEGYYQKYKDATPEEKANLETQRKELERKRREHRKRFELHLFSVAVPVGIIAIVVGSLIPVQAIGTGLIFGGILLL